MGEHALNLEEIKIDKLVNGGQGLGHLSDGRVAFVWNALPGEIVRARILRQKRQYIEALAEQIVESSPLRTTPRDEAYLSTSPWQIISQEGELKAKQDIMLELLRVGKILFKDISIHDSLTQWHYRNKMEYSFWGDDDGLHLALHKRGSKQKQIVRGSSLAIKAVDEAAYSLVDSLAKAGIRASRLKTVVLRSSQEEEVIGSLFVTDREFPKIELPKGLKGLRVYFSNPKSPASVMTELIDELGENIIEDKILGNSFVYDADSFFQVNLGIYESALRSIRAVNIKEPVIDMYSGVGSIGLSLDSNSVKLVELSPVSAKYAQLNTDNSAKDAEVINASAEQSLDYMPEAGTLIVDPPRAGLHDKITRKTLEQKPTKIIYLSCNPSTLVRDIALLSSSYMLKSLELFNFFPKTPHIESLSVLELRTSKA